MRRMFILLITSLLISSCADAGNRRSFYFFLNERYRMTACADMKDEMPNAHAYFSQFTKSKVIYTQYFDTNKSILELRVEVDKLNKPHGYGFIELYKKNGDDIININIDSYLANQLNYQWGVFSYHDFSDTESIYFLTRECVRFRYPVYVEEIGKEVLITFDYTLNKTYEYPEVFKDLSWMV